MGSGGPGHREDEVLKSRLFIAEDPMACREDIKPLSLVRPIVIYDFCPEVRLRKGYVLILYRVSWSVCAHRGTESARGLHFSEAPAECQSRYYSSRGKSQLRIQFGPCGPEARREVGEPSPINFAGFY